jgi:ABC-2 type transport system permease protein
MNTQSNAMSEPFDSTAVSPMSSATQPFYWSVRRELWEYRFIYVAPLAIGALALLAFTISAVVGIWEAPLHLDPTKSYDAVAGPYNMVAGLMMLMSILISVFYCLDALHGERRDRSILFWKSLPVSDVTTVLAKVSIPLVVVPVLMFVITLAMHWAMLVISSGVLLVSGQNVGLLWTKLSLPEMWLLLLYHFITAHAIWPLPVYCWLLLVSGWARRATFLWAALPVVAIAAVERITFHTYHFVQLVASRLIGEGSAIAMTPDGSFPTGPTTHMTPGVFLSSPGLWIGLLLSAAFLIAAIRLRKYEGPI